MKKNVSTKINGAERKDENRTWEKEKESDKNALKENDHSPFGFLVSFK